MISVMYFYPYKYSERLQTTINLEPEKRWYITTRLEEMYNQSSSSSSSDYSIYAVFVNAARRGAIAQGR